MHGVDAGKNEGTLSTRADHDRMVQLMRSIAKHLEELGLGDAKRNEFTVLHGLMAQSPTFVNHLWSQFGPPGAPPIGTAQ